MKDIKVTNTIDSSEEFFNTMQEANEHILEEIEWFNSENENKNGNGYDDSDFIIEESIPYSRREEEYQRKNLTTL
jgi:hypothetical protein